MNLGTLSDWSDIAEIATAFLAVFAYGRYLVGYWRRRMTLENYLKNEYPGKRDKGDQGRRTVLHLVAELRMSEEEVLKAAFRNKRIVSTTAADPATGRAAALYLAYRRENSN
jgi:hypothetical protein